MGRSGRSASDRSEHVGQNGHFPNLNPSMLAKFMSDVEALTATETKACYVGFTTKPLADRIKQHEADA
eukprot:gene26531-33125_t